MRRRPRTRRVLKWVGTVLCVLMVATIVASRWWSATWTRGHYWGFVQWGGIGIGHHNSIDPFRLEAKRNIQTSPLWWWFDWQPGTTTRASCFIVPLWMPLAVITVPTAYLWWRRRGYPAGHCRRCGYNLTANISGRCPECGTPIKESEG